MKIRRDICKYIEQGEDITLPLATFLQNCSGALYDIGIKKTVKLYYDFLTFLKDFLLSFY